MPRPPDWLIYLGVAGALLLFSLSKRENADAPVSTAPEETEGALLGPVTPFDPAVTVNAPDIPFQPSSGTAFSVARAGRWITARHVVEGCRQPAILVGGGRAVAADVRLASRADIAVLITDGGTAAIPVTTDRDLRSGQRGFHPGYPQARPGEATSRLLGRETLLRSYRPEEWLEWFRAAGAPPPLLTGPLFDSSLVLADAAAQGAGVALLPVKLFGRDLQSSRLVRLFDVEVDVGGYWLTRLKRRRSSAAMRAFSEWVVKQSQPA